MSSTDRRRSRTRILDMLRRGPATVDQIVTGLGISRGAVRLQLETLRRDGLVAQSGTHRSATRPSATWEVTERGQISLSRGYVPMLTRLLQVLSERLRPEEFDAVMREVGRSMLAGRERPAGPLPRRVEQASALFNELGGLTAVERGRGRLFIRSHGCPFAATTERHPEACSAVESLFSEFIAAPVETCCEREPRLRCCFAVALRAPRPRATVSR